MEKSADAFRTISEVAEDLALPQHVLRFWEKNFPQIRPLKRAGGRRYYRPNDVVLIRSIRQLLHDEGYTIRGVQRLLKEQGARGLRVGEPTAVLLLEDLGDAADEIAPDTAVFEVPAAATAAPGPAAEPGPLVAPEAGIDEGSSGRIADALREALSCIEDCERILQAVRRPSG